MMIIILKKKTRATSLYGTPTMFIDMQNIPEFDNYDLSTLYTGEIFIHFQGNRSNPFFFFS